MPEVRHLVVVLGDPPDPEASAWDGFDTAQDLAFMCETVEEATQAGCCKQRLTEPGDYSVLPALRGACTEAGVTLELRKIANSCAALINSRPVRLVANRCAWSTSIARCATADWC